jgi:ribosomal protein S18 acetylase RimI-like enzyme
MAAPAPFHQPSYRLEARGGNALTLRLSDAADAEMLGPELAAIEPWARLGMSSMHMRAGIATSDDNKRCFTIWHGEERAGVIVVRHPWLAGPYLNLLGVLPRFQKLGLGRAALGWMEEEAVRAGSRNCFLCVSAFNTIAHKFYLSCGYEKAATLQDLIADGEGEILMRKRLR